MSSGAEQLSDWISRRAVNKTEASLLLGIDPTFLAKLLSGDRTPGLGNAIKIERVTGIAVEAWVSSSLDESDDAVGGSALKRKTDKATSV